MLGADIDGLFSQALRGGYDDNDPWNAVQALCEIGTREVFEKAVRWTESDQPLVRARGLDVIAQIGKTPEHPSNSFPHDAYKVAADAKLFLHARNDQTIPIEHGRKVFAAAAEPKEFVELNAGHADGYKADRARYYAAIDAFIKRVTAPVPVVAGTAR